MDYLQSARAAATADTAAQQIYADLATSYEKKLWHQLTVILIDSVLKSDYFTAAGAHRILELQNSAILKIAHKLNAISYAKFVVVAGRKYQQKKYLCTEHAVADKMRFAIQLLSDAHRIVL